MVIRDNVLGKEHSDYASCLNNLGHVNFELRNYYKAEVFYLEAKTIIEKLHGKQHPDYDRSINLLAKLYLLLGDYKKAEIYYIECRDIREKLLGREHPDYAWSLNSLAILYQVLGNCNRAEQLLMETKAIREKVQGKSHPDYAQSLNNLGLLYQEMGNYEKAETYHLEAKAIKEKVLGKEHYVYSSSLNNLALLYVENSNYEKAESLLLESLAIIEKTSGKEHFAYAIGLNNLSSLYLKMGKYEHAESFCLAANTTFQRVLGNDHHEYASSLNNLAELYIKMEKYEKAESLFLDSKTIYQKSYGRENFEYLRILNNIIYLYERQQRFSESEGLLAEANALTQARLKAAALFLSELELGKYSATFQREGDNLNSFLLARIFSGIDNRIVSSLAYNHALFHKGFLLTAASRRNYQTLASDESKEINLNLKGYQRQLAAEYVKPISERGYISELEEKVNAAEKELTRSVAGYAEALQQVKWEDVKAKLKPLEAAIEFVHFKKNFPTSTDSTFYAALLILPGMEQPKFIPHFEEKALELLVSSNAERKADYVNELYTLADRGLVKLGTEKSSLYELIWKPLEAYLSGIKTIYYSPSGLLHRINVDAIPVSEMETIADKYQMITLNSTRQIVIPTTLDNTNNDAILFGGIQFEQDSTIQNNEDLLTSRSRGDLFFASVDTTLRAGTWNYLAGTEREVKAIEKIMQASGINSSLKRGYEASEESFKNIGIDSAPSPRVLHIATHGYFFPDPKRNATGTGLGGEQESVFKISDHPMLRSGLILAGGNAAWQGNQTLEGKEDGILTAYEISQMNLSNTELVVLSACETGLGEIQGNEGVYGLQRAFKIAGAKYLIMSLWQVPDKQTSLLMTTFYRKWLEEKMTIPVAFHVAQKELRDLGLDPYHWAGFVLVE